MEAARTVLCRNAMIEFNPIPALVWRAIGVRLRPTRRALCGEGQTFAGDRANDAHAGADARRGSTSLRKEA
jgi:hypothetical protein